MDGGFMSSFFKKKTDKEESCVMKFGLARIFKYQELKKATNSFATEVGHGGYGRVYLGKLGAGQMVAVKVLFDRNPQRLEQFFNEVNVLSRVRHNNLIRLYGSTLPNKQELLLVYEYAHNGTVADHLHGQQSALDLSARIRIAVEAAEALAYLHGMEPPIVHRDVKTSNILLDSGFHAKVADLGICRLLPWDTDHVSTLPQGTMGYRDPEYDRCFRLTDKTDVYSFGVVLIELISGQQAVDVTRKHIYLDCMAISKIMNDKLEEIVDPKLGYHANNDIRRMINSVAQLAVECLKPFGNLRPSMAQVVTVLEGFQYEMEQIGLNGFVSLSSNPQKELGQGSLDHLNNDRDNDSCGSPLEILQKEMPAIPSAELRRVTGNFGQNALIGEGGYYRVFKAALNTFTKRKKATLNIDQELKGVDLQTRSFTLRQIKEATKNFDAANKIGEGGFGSVYKGVLSDETVIAVKQLSSISKQGNREFVNEIGMLFGLQHPNLVKLYGCCIDGDQLLLVYEYMENNSLGRALFGNASYKADLDWPTRRKIFLGIAKGLTYLHEESRLRIVHRDIKASNVLLDKDLNAKISDFGLAKLFEDEDTHISTRIAGTMGYMAPEYALRGYLTEKADVYSFGVLALEIVSGKSNSNYRPKEECIFLVDRAYLLGERGSLLELIDPDLGSDYSEEEAMLMLQLALLCTNASHTLRPAMSKVVSLLEGLDSVQPVFNPGYAMSTRVQPRLLVNHCVGSKSFVRYREELRDAETLQELGRIEFYKKTHYVESEFGSHWTSPLAEQNYEAMKKLQSQPVPDGADPMPEDDICDEILGIRPGYIRGLGHGRVSLSSSSSPSFNSEIAELTKRAEEAEKLNEELKDRVLDQDQKIEEMKATQERKMEEMQANMEGMAAKLEAFISKFGRDSSSWSASRE